MRSQQALLCSAIATLAWTAPAFAERALLLKTESVGGAEAAVVSGVEAQLEKSLEGEGHSVTRGQTTLTDTATIAGCVATEPPCGEQLLDTVDADLLVSATVERVGERTGHVHRVSITRLRRGTPPQTTTVELLSQDAASTEAAVAAHLGGNATVAQRSLPTPPGGSEPQAEAPLTDPQAPAARGLSRTGLQIGGMITGGVLVLGAVAFWAKAADLNTDIAAAPTRTPEDFERLVRLEDRAASAAIWGDVLFVGGAVVGGAAAYWWVRTRNSSTSTNHAWAPIIAPAPGGGMVGVRWQPGTQ